MPAQLSAYLLFASLHALLLPAYLPVVLPAFLSPYLSALLQVNTLNYQYIEEHRHNTLSPDQNIIFQNSIFNPQMTPQNISFKLFFLFECHLGMKNHIHEGTNFWVRTFKFSFLNTSSVHPYKELIITRANYDLKWSFTHKQHA